MTLSRMNYRKPRLLLVTGLSVLLCLSGNPLVAVLTNGDFEDNGTGLPWTFFNNFLASPAIVTAPEVTPQSGTQAAKLHTSAGFDAGVIQAGLPVGPGDIVRVEGYMYQPSSAQLTGSAFAFTKLEFEDVGGTRLLPGIVTEGIVDFGFPFFGAVSQARLEDRSEPAEDVQLLDTWIHAVIEAEAPATAVEFNVLGLVVASSGTPVYFDNFSVTVTPAVVNPEPSTYLILMSALVVVAYCRRKRLALANQDVSQS